MNSSFNLRQTSAARRIIYLSFLLLPAVYSIAQNNSLDGDIWKGDFWRSVYHDTAGNRIDITRFYKGRTNEKERVDSVFEYKNGSRFESKTYFLAGDTNLVFQYFYDSLKQLRYERIKGFGTDGKLQSDSTRWLSPRGTESKVRIYDPAGRKYKTRILRDGKWVEVAAAPVAEIKEGDGQPTPGSFPARRRNNFPKLELAASYSYLRADNGTSGFGMPIGANLSFVYNLNSKLGLALDASYHSGEKNDQKYDRQYAMAGIQYKCGDCCCDPAIFTHALVGYGREGFRFMNFKNSNTGFIAALGAGLDFNIGHKTCIKLKTDAIANFFDDDNMQIDYRAGLGVGLNLSRRSSTLSKNPYINLKRY